MPPDYLLGNTAYNRFEYVRSPLTATSDTKWITPKALGESGKDAIYKIGDIVLSATDLEVQSNGLWLKCNLQTISEDNVDPSLLEKEEIRDLYTLPSDTIPLGLTGTRGSAAGISKDGNVVSILFSSGQTMLHSYDFRTKEETIYNLNASDLYESIIVGDTIVVIGYVTNSARLYYYKIGTPDAFRSPTTISVSRYSTNWYYSIDDPIVIIYSLNYSTNNTYNLITSNDGLLTTYITNLSNIVTNGVRIYSDNRRSPFFAKYKDHYYGIGYTSLGGVAGADGKYSLIKVDSKNIENVVISGGNTTDWYVSRNPSASTTYSMNSTHDYYGWKNFMSDGGFVYKDGYLYGIWQHVKYSPSDRICTMEWKVRRISLDTETMEDVSSDWTTVLEWTVPSSTANSKLDTTIPYTLYLDDRNELIIGDSIGNGIIVNVITGDIFTPIDNKYPSTFYIGDYYAVGFSKTINASPHTSMAYIGNGNFAVRDVKITAMAIEDDPFNSHTGTANLSNIIAYFNVDTQKGLIHRAVPSDSSAGKGSIHTSFGPALSMGSLPSFNGYIFYMGIDSASYPSLYRIHLNKRMTPYIPYGYIKAKNE